MHIGALISIASTIYTAISASKAADSAAPATAATDSTASTSASRAAASPSTVVSLSGHPLSEHDFNGDGLTYGHLFAQRSQSRTATAAATSEAAENTDGTQGAQKAAAATTTITADASNGTLGIDPSQILLPTRENVAALLQQATARLGNALDKAGISRTPGFDFEMDPTTGRISVSGDRPDKAAIEQIINADPALARNIQNASGIASHLPSMARAEEYNGAVSKARTQQEADAITARYADIFSGSGSVPSLRFRYDGKTTSLDINHQWMTIKS